MARPLFLWTFFKKRNNDLSFVAKLIHIFITLNHFILCKILPYLFTFSVKFQIKVQIQNDFTKIKKIKTALFYNFCDIILTNGQT